MKNQQKTTQIQKLEKQQDIMIPAHEIIKPHYKCSICQKKFKEYSG